MARSISYPGFLRLPPATAALLISAAFGLTNGHALPRQTKTVELHELNVVSFPQPTEAPILLSDLLPRQAQNTVCGYIGGDTNLPATCSAGSHCVLEKDHGVVGCCPDGGPCSTGIFTGCVDRNSDLQTELNPYVYTCQGSNVCYRNEFAGGYFQFGCGTASSLGTTVETSVDGMTSLVFESNSMLLTALPTALPEPTSIGSQPSSVTDDPTGDPSSSLPNSSSPNATPTSATSVSSASNSLSSSSLLTSSGSSSSSSSSSSKSSSTTKTSSSTTASSSSTGTPTTTNSAPVESSTDPSAPAAVGSSTTNRGAIIGGSIAGAAVLIAVLVAIALFYLRKRRNNREGPGPLPTDAPPRTDYISPMSSHGAAFAPLPSWQDDEEDTRPLTQYPQPYHPIQEPWQAEPSMAAAARPPTTNRGFSQPLRYHPATIRPVVPLGGVGTGLTPVAEEENPSERGDHDRPSTGTTGVGMAGGPRSSELDDFSRAYSSAGIGTQEIEDDRQPLTATNSDENTLGSGAISPEGSQTPPRGGGGGNRPLWQQNRQQGRNMMWL
ncbi:uncharacterized protein F4822DRAFT_34071 [Hypoxylon trugodes]|uniref:uncharacterized protein n=1 Tax=Hypoxylon trugodes TaxID=326681 RepID=UPI00219E629F|nr:uncharacterized protein F4822DRAFT_34071 [Hypoxylon trugodes]KAI1394026.1 hypothetical protein F4822DRAFT_34071 [Hypoxylon trugodes]